MEISTGGIAAPSLWAFTCKLLSDRSATTRAIGSHHPSLLTCIVAYDSVGVLLAQSTSVVLKVWSADHWWSASAP